LPIKPRTKYNEQQQQQINRQKKPSAQCKNNAYV